MSRRSHSFFPFSVPVLILHPGIYGLAVCKTYLEVNPQARVLVLDAGATLGGTWAKERIYEELFSNNIAGMLEFSDFEMSEERFGVKVSPTIFPFVKIGWVKPRYRVQDGYLMDHEPKHVLPEFHPGELLICS
jgi:cation diffusion facilitator CzcD-associated flavoprotein CzcO